MAPSRRYTLDDLKVKASVEADPEAFVSSLPARALIDEIQRAPDLLLTPKAAIDRDRFVLTGSADLLNLPPVRESLAGRVLDRAAPLEQNGTFPGSGSKSNVSVFGVVAVDKKDKTVKMHPLALRERQGFTHEASQTLPERIVEPFDVGRLPGFFAHRVMLLTRNHLLICLPKVAIARRFFVSPHHARPCGLARKVLFRPRQRSACFFATISHR